MATLIDRYFETLIERLQQVKTSQAAAIDVAAEVCADSIAREKLVFTFGTGHGALPALETFPRTGTIVGFRPIVESTMISFHRVWGDMGARQYRFIHAVEGYGRAILRSHRLDPADTMVLFSHSGINAVILDIAIASKELGLKVIGVTSLTHSWAAPSRHSSGKKLFEVADVVIDTCAALADAALKIEGLGEPVGGQLDIGHHRHRPCHRLGHRRKIGGAWNRTDGDGQPQHHRARGGEHEERRQLQSDVAAPRGALNQPREFMDRELFIDGGWRKAIAGARLEIKDPATGEHGAAPPWRRRPMSTARWRRLSAPSGSGRTRMPTNAAASC